MYLKSLSLKGFKSFADKSTLSMEPGLSAIVGPNGSGKSNISDAVLWVLGERSARNLRGQAMEDVIFAGSSARKPVSVAEVTLVLDNTDGVLPVEYDEVSITRRLFRTGESEYLINGVMARRMDVQDILHDSGLGTGTNSIISQGSLDEVLQSKPEDRRALIEEAAGVLKHKQRKEKSQRKLAAMDAHLVRVKDISEELHKQLGPLERKAKRALRYQRLAEELSDLTLALAVDDLRTLQGQWNDVVKQEGRLEDQVQEKQEALDQAQAHSEALQQLLQASNEDASAASFKYQQAATAVERLESVNLLLSERHRTIQLSQEDHLRKAEEGQAKLEEARQTLMQSRERLDAAHAEAAAAREAVQQLSEESNRNAADRRVLNEAIAKAESDKKRDDKELSQLESKLARVKEALEKGLSHVNLVDAKREDLQRRLVQARADAADCAEACEQAESALGQLKEAESSIRVQAGAALSRRDEAQKRFEAEREGLSLLSSEIRALEELERSASTAGAARVWVLDHAQERQVKLLSLAHVLRVAPELEHVVERFLGADVSALLTSDIEDARSLALDLLQNASQGEVRFLCPGATRGDAALARVAAAEGFGRALLDEVEYPQEYASQVEALLGAVLLADDLDDALSQLRALKAGVAPVSQAASALISAEGLCFLTKDGCVLSSDGKLLVGLLYQEDAAQGASSRGASTAAYAGVLSRARQLDQMRNQLASMQVSRDEAESQLRAAEKAFADAQEQSLKLAQQRAEAQGKADSARSRKQQAENLLQSLEREFREVERQRLQAQLDVDEARPQLALIEESIAQIKARIAATEELVEDKQRELKPLKDAGWNLTERLNQAKLSQAKLSEREIYEQRMLERSQAEVEALEAQIAAARLSFDEGCVAALRIGPLMACISALKEGALSCADRLQEMRFEVQDQSSGLAREAADARARVRANQDELSAATELLSQTRIGKGRLEVQVEGAVDSIVHTCGTPLERALELPVLEERAQAQESAAKIERQISSMGVINPDAAQEYEELKERCDYLDGQLSDLASARKSLARIVAAIDERMKGDFIDTFEAVNRNFQEVFSLLFPGGTAQLMLTNPLDLENTGVEISAQPQGKRVTKMMLLSGGEKSLTAMALLFAVYNTRATPFYILDEVEAALDDSNLRRLLNYLEYVKEHTQLIMITHQRRTMEAADVLFGVSMRADGVTKVISQRLEKALEYAEKK